MMAGMTPQSISPAPSSAPLAARMRPRTLDEFMGQSAIVGPGRLLRRAIQADQLSSLIFYGPPGTGKTTLAQIIANTTQAQFIAINAVLSGVKEIREAIATAQSGLPQRTILFIDEVHRFNKSQQDALLPWVENGTVILIGATTENPYFEVNKALVSRSRLFQLKSLDENDLRQVVQMALADRDRGYGKLSIQLDEDALDHLVNIANGDARALLNALELAVETTPAEIAPANAPVNSPVNASNNASDNAHDNDSVGVRHITLAVAEESIQHRAVLYDKEGDAHFDTISAFIKSIRGSDADAALYWLARMVYAGEDPRYIFRRLVILASEDVGLADPQAVGVVNACAAAFDRVGLPEGRYPLAQATLYLATTAKSNSVMGFFDALAAVEQEKEAEPPNHLKDANRDKKSFGHGAGYLYPHAYRDHWVEQQYLPKSLQGQVFFQPSNQGYEAQIQLQVTRRREAQLAALVEGAALPEVLSFGPTNVAQDRWLQRSQSQVGEQLAQVRDRLFAMVPIQRHHVILDLNAGSGLLTWEAVRRTPEGGVFACVRTAQDATALTEQAVALNALVRPTVWHTDLAALATVLEKHDSKLRFDLILGRNALMREPDKASVVQMCCDRLLPAGALVLAESIPRRSQRLYALLDSAQLNTKLMQKWIKAEELIYTKVDDPMVNWDVEHLRQIFSQLGVIADVTVETTSTPMVMTSSLIDRWFATPSEGQPSYAQRLNLSASETDQIRQALTRLVNQTVNWQGAIAFIHAHR